MTRKLTICALLIFVWFPEVAPEASSPETVLDGNRKSFVVVGYSTSFMWPDILQFMLDRHEEGAYDVLNAAVGSSPVVRWLDGAEQYEQTYTKMLSDYFGEDAKKRGDRPVPAIALCQQSLQGVFEKFRDGIRHEEDAVRITKGANALQALAAQLNDSGIQTVYIAMHIFKISMEPAIWNERHALNELLARQVHYVRPGPDLWRVTKDSYPEGFSPVDRVHPSLHGSRIMAEGWYRTLAGDAAKDEVVKAMWGHPFDTIADREAETNRRGLERQREFRAKQAKQESQ